MIGLGYIGLPTAAVMASKGLNVHGVDINQVACDIINQGKIHITEPGLDEVVSSAVLAGKLVASTTPKEADVFVIAVPTPFNVKSGPDVSYIKKAAESIAPVLKKGDLVILESTSPVGTTEKLSTWLSKEREDLHFPLCDDDSDIDVSIAYCPERVLPGKVIEELVANDRIIGGLTDVCSNKAKAFYSHFVEGQCYKTNARTAELAKLTENSSRDVGIAFANELSMICDDLSIDVGELIRLANKHPRVNILQPGCGVGGHCIAVDPWFIVDSAPTKAVLIRQARDVNDSKPEWVVEKIKNMVLSHLVENKEKTLSSITISLYGLAFKPNIDDTRESPALYIVNKLASSTIGKAIKLNIVEPNLSKTSPVKLQKSDNIKLVDLDEALKSTLHVVLVGHDEFKKEPLLCKNSGTTLNFAWDTTADN